MQGRRAEDQAFEAEVRRVAEAIWQQEPGACQPAWYTGDPVLHELDGILRLPDITHLLMATTSTKLDKAKSDVVKLNAAARKEQYRSVPVEKWLITERQLDAEHIQYAAKSQVKVLTLENFRARVFDGRDYIGKRRKAAFGSARNLQDGSISIPEDEYIELPMEATLVTELGKGVAPGGKPVELDTVIEHLRKGDSVVLLGPFGAGKSLTARETFLRLAKPYLRGPGLRVPLAINLREHWGAQYGDEILERHARAIGFSPRTSLTGAWRAGLTSLLLDGFDELASQVIARPTDKHFLRRARFESLQAVRDLVGKVPQGSGVLLCGRDHYFDNVEELISSLALTGRRFWLVRLQEFSEDRAAAFLKRHGKKETLPDWLPRKPLILGYLAHQDLLDKILRIDASRGFGFAWDSFITLVCNREAQLERAVMEPRTIRRVLERLSCVVRATSSGTGPISGLDLAEAYRAEAGEGAGEGVLAQLQRLPGLTPREQDPAARSFVDQDLLAALQGSAVVRAVVENSGDLVEGRWLTPLTRDGIRMAAYLLESNGFDPATVLATARRLGGGARCRVEKSQLVADCLAVAIELSDDDGDVDAGGVSIPEAVFDVVDLEQRRLHGVMLSDCTIETLVVGEGLYASRLRVENSIVGAVSGVQSATALPKGMFVECAFGAFDDASTNAAVLRLDIVPPVKALMTVLRKLYLQAGGGRKLSALKRGLPGGPILDAVDPVLEILESEGVVAVSDEIAHPIRRQTSRVHKILAAGALASDPIIDRVREI